MFGIGFLNTFLINGVGLRFRRLSRELLYLAFFAFMSSIPFARKSQTGLGSRNLPCHSAGYWFPLLWLTRGQFHSFRAIYPTIMRVNKRPERTTDRELKHRLFCLSLYKAITCTGCKSNSMYPATTHRHRSNLNFSTVSPSAGLGWTDSLP